MWRFLLEFVVTAILVSGAVWFGYRQGYRQAYKDRLEGLAKNARHRANQASAEARVLEAAQPPRVRQARVKGTSRRDLAD